MPLFDRDNVRLTAAEHGRLMQQAARNGRGDEMPSVIRDKATLEEARLVASGGRVLEELEQFIEHGTCPAVRGELTLEEIFGERSEV